MFQGRKTPGVLAEMRHRNDLMLYQIGWLVNDWVPEKIPGRSRDHATNFAEADRNETRIRQMSDPQRDIDAFVDQIHLSVDEKQPDRHCRIFVHEGVDHRSYQVFPGDDWRGQVPRGAARSPPAAISASSRSISTRRQAATYRS